jgi:phage shock protein A
MMPVLREYLVPSGPFFVAVACSQAAAVSSALEAQQAAVADLRAKLSTVEADARALQAQVEEATAHRDQLQVPYSVGDVLCAWSL